MLKCLLADINSILKKHSISQISIEHITVTDNSVIGIDKPDKPLSSLIIPISIEHIIVTNDSVTGIDKPNKSLSSLIIDKIWPSVESATVFHYTSKDKAESILNSGNIRLYSILKRYTDDEVSAFCKAHSLNGYLEKDTNGQELYKTLIMPNTFYSSFTTTTVTPNQEEYFWRTFAANDGVRLKIAVKASHPDFRRIVYPKKDGNPLPILFELTHMIREEYQREFILKGISRLCAFYLSKQYEIESEFRMLHRYCGLGPKPMNDGEFDFIEVPLGSMSELGYQLNIIEIQTNETLQIPLNYHVVRRNS